jgi:predicted nucleic acid-binding Zn ribbon protein
MKHCPYCSAPVEPTANFCTNCGNRLPAEGEPTPTPAPRKKKSSALPIVLSIVGVVLFLCAIFLGIYLRNRSTNQNTTTAISEEDSKNLPSDDFFSEEEDDDESTTAETPAVESGTTDSDSSSSSQSGSSSSAPVIQGQVVEPNASPSPSRSPSGSSSSGETHTYQGVTVTGDYVLPESSSRYYTRSELSGLSKTQLRLARNEIFARHGRLFNDESLQAYFDSCDWYYGYIQPDDFNLDTAFNDYEKANVKLIGELEDELGG